MDFSYIYLNLIEIISLILISISFYKIYRIKKDYIDIVIMACSSIYGLMILLSLFFGYTSILQNISIAFHVLFYIAMTLKCIKNKEWVFAIFLIVGIVLMRLHYTSLCATFLSLCIWGGTPLIYSIFEYLNYINERSNNNSLAIRNKKLWKIVIIAAFTICIAAVAVLNVGKESTKVESVQLNDINVLDVVSIGSYEQDNNIENGNERIEWIVLNKTDEEVLLVSKNILDVQQYNSVPGEVTWENSSLKKWLNKEFYNYAFSNDEQSIVIGNSSENVTLLNIDEVREYQGIIDSNLDEFTIFSYDKTYQIMSRPDNDGFNAPYGEMMHRQVYSGWWIKSSNPLDYAMTYGFFDDEVMENSGMKVTANFIGVRPVIRIKNALKTEDGKVVLESWFKSKSDTKEYLKNKKIRFDDTRLSEYTISEYDENGRETKITSYDKNDNAMIYYAIVEYDKNDNMIKWLDYDENNIKYSETEFIYNEDDRLVKEIIFDENGQQAATIEYTYEGCNRIQKWIDKDGNVDTASGFIEELDINGNRVKGFSYENGAVDEFTKFFYGQHGEYLGSEQYNSDWLLEDKETSTIIE